MSAEAAALCRSRDLDRPTKIVLHISSESDFAALKLVFQTLSDECWPLMTADDHQISSFAPDLAVIVCGDAGAIRSRVGSGIVAHVSPSVARDAAGLASAVTADLVCATTESDAEALVEAGVDRRKIGATGAPIGDLMFRTGRLPVPRQMDGGRRWVVFAPHASATSAAVMLGDFFNRAVDALPDDYGIAILPHPDTLRGQPLWIENWRHSVGKNDRVLLLEAPGVNAVEVLSAGELLITDPGDKAALFLAMDRPLIMSGKRHVGAHALPEISVEAMEQAAYMIFDPERLEDMLRNALGEASAMSEQRARARSILYDGCTDARAAERVAEAVLAAGRM